MAKPKAAPSTAALTQALTQPTKPPAGPGDYLKTGSTVLDLALSGSRLGGFLKGHYFWIVGDSSSGKTFLTLTCLAEASINPAFDGYRLIYDNVEDGALMDIEKYFGPSLAKRLEAPATQAGKPVHSTTIEEFYYHLDDALDQADKGKPCIYLLDSMDALDSKYAEKKFQEAKREARGGAKAKGDYGDGKAKVNSTRMRAARSRLQASGSILVVLSQTRDNIDAGPFEEQQTHAGGRALKFYATAQLWSSVGRKIKRTVRGRELVVGVYCKVRIKKNRLTGKDRTVEFPIYYSHGIDDLGGMVDYLVYWKHWPVNSSGIIDASNTWEGVAKRREDLVRWVEENALREDLEEVVEECLKELEDALAVNRKSKYGP